MGNCAPRVTWSMWRSRLLSPESNDLTGTAIRKSHCPAWQTPFATRLVADSLRLVERMRDVVGESALLQNPLAVGGVDKRCEYQE